MLSGSKTQVIAYEYKKDQGRYSLDLFLLPKQDDEKVVCEINCLDISD